MGYRGHELRLIPHPWDGQSFGIQPYCPCGWIGQADHHSAHEDVSEAFLRHLEAVAAGRVEQ